MNKQIFILIGLAIVAVIGFFFVSANSNSNSGILFETEQSVLEANVLDDKDDNTMFTTPTETQEPVLQGTVFVDVQGEVVNPGVFEVDAHVRIGYLIDLAGGLTEDANVRGLNQAARIYDEMVIFVPHVDDIHENEHVIGGNDLTDGREDVDESGLISLSTATALELQSLPGIGPTLSTNIIAYREESGPFSTIDELIHVSGIGAGTLENIREFIKP